MAFPSKMNVILQREWFLASAVELAPLLVGKLLCRRIGDEVIRLRITETECYFGEEDTACHAHKGKTDRTEVMYGRGGRAYVYLCYGMHNMLNITTGGEGHPEAVLLRGVEGAMGPGRLTKLLQIDRGLNRAVLSPDCGLWVEDDGFVSEIVKGKRIGIGYASLDDQEKLWRFTEKTVEKTK